MSIKLNIALALMLSIATTAFSEVTLGTSVGTKDVSWDQADAVEVTNATLPTRLDHNLRRAYLEFRSDLPAGSHIELWWTDQTGAPWDTGGDILDLWVMEEATGTQVKLSLKGWIKRGGSGKLYLREGIASNEDGSELVSEGIDSILIQPRFTKK